MSERRRRIWMERWGTVLLALLAGACAAREGGGHGPGPADPIEGRSSIALELLGSVDAAPGTRGFDLALDWVTDRAGVSYVLEYPSARIRAIAPDGEPLRTLERHTTGPRAASEALALALLPDSTLGLLLPSPATLIKLDRRGNPVGRAPIQSGDAHPGVTTIVRRAIGAGGILVLGGTDSRLDSLRGQVRTHFVRRYGVGGEILATYLSREAVVDMRQRHFDEREALAPFTLSFAVGPDGRVYIAPERDALRIEVFSPEGVSERVIEKDFAARPRTAADSSLITILFDAWAEEVPAGIHYTFAASEPAIEQMQVDGQGRLWVLSSRGRDDLAPGEMARYELFAPDGRPLPSLTVRGPASATERLADAGLLLLPDGRIAALGQEVSRRWLRQGGRLGWLTSRGMGLPASASRALLCRIGD